MQCQNTCCIGCNKGGLCSAGVAVPSASPEGGSTPQLDELGFQGSWFLCDVRVASSPAPGQLVLRVMCTGMGCGERKAELQSSKFHCPCWVL